MSLVHVIGTVNADGRFTTAWWGAVPDDAPRPTGPDGGWSAVALDATGQVLALAPAALTSAPVCRGGPVDRLNAYLPLVPGTDAIAVRHRDTEAYRRPVPQPAGVSLDTAPLRGGQLARKPIEVPVVIEGPPPPPGAHLLPRWEAPGRPVSPLGLIDVGAGARPVVQLDLAALSGGDGCRLHVTYSDSVRTVTVTSPPLAVEPRLASLAIAAPGPDAVLHDVGLVLLEGVLDGDGDPAQMEWLFDGVQVHCGRQGHIARPDAGSHTVTLRHGDVSVSTEITVRKAPAEPVAAPWQPPWRTGPVRSVGVPTDRG